MQDIASQLRVDIAEVRKVGRELRELGAICKTVDDDHWKLRPKGSIILIEPASSSPLPSLAASRLYNFLRQIPQDEGGTETHVDTVARELHMDIKELRKNGKDLLDMAVMGT